ncbi:pyruvate dehydrogenase complex dihydrolipoamide acetyltransferase [bacterium]|nr:pyruvate dehydrogenase complex dihydrolipoamide acetyltransferase [bacterium]MCP5462073.1 pyruvate dehydrogenase complex dihydrolipoamide acetyltransferase [bacterium]
MAEPILMIALSPTMEQGTIARWNKKEGDPVKSGDIICDVETDKATMEYECPEDGILLKIVVANGGKASVGQLIAVIGEKGENVDDLVKQFSTQALSPKHSKSKTAQQEDTKENDSESDVVSKQNAIHRPGGIVKASPLAKRIAKQHGYDLAAIAGTGPGGRIVKRDIESLLKKGSVVSGEASSPVSSTLVDEILPVSGMRKIIAQRLTESKYSAPHYYLKLSIDMGALIGARKALNKSINSTISLNAFLMKFTAEAIKRHPIINSTWKGDTIVKHGSIDIGLAVALPEGLITPIVRNCASKGIIEIDNELRMLIEKAQNNSLAQNEYNGATFTITNLGSYGIEDFTAIINPPGSAILAVGAIIKTPVVAESDELEIKQMMKVSLSSDHRVIDGAVGASFLKDLKDLIENPIRTLY